MSEDPARAFLSRVLPWGDDRTYMNIHWTLKSPGYKTELWTGNGVKTLAEALSAVRYASTKAKHVQGIYACMSSQTTVQQKTVNGFTFNEAVRAQKNAVVLKALFLDIDVKKDAYETTEEAIQAVTKFVQDAGLPPPTMVVFSGSGGMHVYWTLDENLPVHEWQPLANALVEATRRFGLMCDAAVTVDSSRILRVPGTLNKKGRTPRPVVLAPRQRPDLPVQVMRDALAPYLGAKVIQLRPAGKDVNDELATITPARPVLAESVAENCGFVREALATGGAGYANPLWNLSTLVATFMEDGEAVAHRMALAHPAYDREETQALYERKLREREQKNLGWPSCQSIQNAGCTSCATCPLLALGKSPLNHGMPALRAGAVRVKGARNEQHLPAGFVHDENGIVYERVQSRNGMTDEHAVCSYPLYDANLYKEPWPAFGFLTRVGNPAREIHIALRIETYAGAVEQLGKALASSELVTHRHERESLARFLVAWIQHLQTIRDAVVSGHSYGWSVVSGKYEGFSYGGRVWLPGGLSRSVPLMSPALDETYMPRGELATWINASRFITSQKRPALDVILAMSFGSALVKLAGHTGLLISVYSSDSGAGKTTAVRISQAVWGNPRKAQRTDDTANSINGKMTTLRNLPIYWDELKTDEDTAKFVNFAFGLGQGVGKSRMAADTSLREVGQWETIVLSASNDSILDYIARKVRTTPAGIVRCFEFIVPPGPQTALPSEVDRMVAELENHYGEAGLVFVKHISENVEAVREEVKDTHDKLVRHVKMDNEERFWVASMACVCVGARIANRLGLTEIDEQAMLKFLLTAFKRLREESNNKPVNMRKTLNVVSIFGEFLSAMRARHTLVTKCVPAGRGRPGSDACTIVNAIDKLDTIFVHRGQDDGIVRVVGRNFSEWLTKNNYSPGIVTQAMKDRFGEGGVREMIGIMGGGTSVSVGVKQHILEVDLNRAELTSMGNEDEL